MDRTAITAHIKKNTFKTIIGEVDIRGQHPDKVWTVGQWQRRLLHAVARFGFSNYAGKKQPWVRRRAKASDAARRVRIAPGPTGKKTITRPPRARERMSNPNCG